MTDERLSARGSRCRLLKILLFLLFIGGAGGLLGSEAVIRLYGANCARGGKAGAVLLLVSACLAAPAAFLLGLPSGSGPGSAARGFQGGNREN